VLILEVIKLKELNHLLLIVIFIFKVVLINYILIILLNSKMTKPIKKILIIRI